ncbi:hypothetical protein NKH77_23335 [Streptomyces sp. M19]
MDGTKRMFDDYRDDIGDGGVVDKMDDFESNWHDGREDIGKQLDGLSKMADTVVREVGKYDGDLGAKLKKNVKKEDRGKIGNEGGGQNGGRARTSRDNGRGKAGGRHPAVLPTALLGLTVAVRMTVDGVLRRVPRCSPRTPGQPCLRGRAGAAATGGCRWAHPSW